MHDRSLYATLDPVRGIVNAVVIAAAIWVLYAAL
jgi:hypothetical protein